MTCSMSYMSFNEWRVTNEMKLCLWSYYFLWKYDFILAWLCYLSICNNSVHFDSLVSWVSLICLIYGYVADLHSIGGLVPLLGYLKNTHANVRAKAAEVVTTIVQNNPRSQQLVMEANGFEPLLSNFTSDPDVTVRTKALGAISCKYCFWLYVLILIIRACMSVLFLLLSLV